MNSAVYKLEVPANEPVLTYKPGSKERGELKEKIISMRASEIEIPCIIGGKEIRTGNFGECRIPHEHGHLLGRYHKAGEKEVSLALEAAAAAAEKWADLSWEQRLSIFQRASDLLAGPWRQTLNAATMLCQSKNAYQAEIDSACELIDFFRFNSYYARRIYEDQPISPRGIWNRTEYRPLEGFVFAVTPFNFTSIAGNLPSAPALLGNVVLWKPASSAVYSGYHLMKLFMEAGLPEGVINFIPGDGGAVGDAVLKNPNLSGIHFTGSTAVFQGMWKILSGNIQRYKNYPRIVGETGGKDFIFAHPSADLEELVSASVRGAFEYQGQKCSAASRAFIPESLWPEYRKMAIESTESLRMGPPEDFRNFVNAVIDAPAFKRITGAIEKARQDKAAEIIAGGSYDDSEGYFIRPTIIRAESPDYFAMKKELFGPVFTVYVYKDERIEEALEACDKATPYGLTGSVFARNRYAIERISKALVNTAGNFYINDKPTGAIVGQQPFGGGRSSGTNDKAGSAINLYRWLSVRAIKENFLPSKEILYPFMQEE